MQNDWKERVGRLIAIIGGPTRRGENSKGYIGRVAGLSGVHPDSVHHAYYGRYCSANSLEKFERAARNADHTGAVEAFAAYQIQLYETDAEVNRSEIDATREYVARMRELGERRRRISRHLDLSTRCETDEE